MNCMGKLEFNFQLSAVFLQVNRSSGAACIQMSQILDKYQHVQVKLHFKSLPLGTSRARFLNQLIYTQERPNALHSGLINATQMAAIRAHVSWHGHCTAMNTYTKNALCKSPHWLLRRA